MYFISWRLALLLLVASLSLPACARTAAGSTNPIEPPAKLEQVEGTKIKRVRLSQQAAQRLDIQVDSVREMQASGALQKAIPYAAVLYDPAGQAWTYTNPEHLLFVRQPIKVDRIEGAQALLSEGPAIGVPVVTVGVAELYGAELGLGK